MGWARFDDCYTDHPKIVAAGPMAELLDVRAILYCARYETDGKVPRDMLAKLGVGISSVKSRANRLVEVGRWAVTADGWEVLDFLEYNPSHADRESEREAARRRMERVRSGRKQSPGSPDVRANLDRTSGEVRVAGGSPYPDPTPIGNSSLDSLTRGRPQAVEKHDAPRPVIPEPPRCTKCHRLVLAEGCDCFPSAPTFARQEATA